MGMTESPRRSGFHQFALLAGVVMLFSGCGGESGLSASELAERANRICARYKPLYGTVTNAHTDAAVVRYLDRTRPASLREQRELRALRPRQNDVPPVQRLVDHVRVANRMLDQLRNALAAHDHATAVKLVRRLGVETRLTTKEARALGWTVCASDPRK
jgi:hypothetical protein